MKTFFTLLTIGLIVIGFVIPAAWVFAIVTGILAMCSSPPGRRTDGKRRTGGLLGGVWDDMVIASRMRNCPYCKLKIMADAQKCPHCAEWVEPTAAQYKFCTACKTKNRFEDSRCIQCGNPI